MRSWEQVRQMGATGRSTKERGGQERRSTWAVDGEGVGGSVFDALHGVQTWH